MTRILLGGLVLICAMALGACSSNGGQPADAGASLGPTIDAGANGCAPIQVLTAFDGSLVNSQAIAVGPDGTVYVSAFVEPFLDGGSGDLTPSEGIFAIPPEGVAPVIVPGTEIFAIQPMGLWVEGDHLLVGSLNQLFDVALPGGGVPTAWIWYRARIGGRGASGFT